MYTVIGTTRSRAARVVWLLEELGAPYAHIAAGPRSPEVLAHNPTGKVPVLLVDGMAITDSTAILHYLSDRHGALTHAPGTLDRAQQDSVTNFVLDEFDAALWTAARHSFILPAEHRLPAIKDTLRWELARSQTRLAERLGDATFLAGGIMTLADIIATHCLLWCGLAKFPVTEPRLLAYVARMQARPAFARAMAR